MSFVKFLGIADLQNTFDRWSVKQWQVICTVFVQYLLKSYRQILLLFRFEFKQIN